MNLFIIGWHISSKIQHIVLDQLAQTSKSYPSLDSSKLWSCKFESGSIFGYIPESQPFVNSNVFYDQDTVVFYDGVIVNYQNTFNTQNARELNDHWRELRYLSTHLKLKLLTITLDSIKFITGIVEKHG
jgi:hypothetical protein